MKNLMFKIQLRKKTTKQIFKSSNVLLIEWKLCPTNVNNLGVSYRNPVVCTCVIAFLEIILLFTQVILT